MNFKEAYQRNCQSKSTVVFVSRQTRGANVEDEVRTRQQNSASSQVNCLEDYISLVEGRLTGDRLRLHVMR